MTGPAGLIAFVLIWCAVGYRTWVLVRKNRGQPAWAWWRALLALAGAVTLFVPPFYEAFYRLTGVPNLAELVGHGLLLVSGWQGSAVLLFLAYGTDPPTARRMLRLRRVMALATLVVITVFFTLIPAEENTTRFTTVYADAPYITHYWVTYLFAINVLQADVARLFLNYSRKSTREALRIGLRIVGAGVLVGMAYWAHWMVFLVLRRTSGHTPGWLDAWGTICAVSAVLLIVIGSMVPAWGRRVGLRGPVTAWREFRSWKRMQPLWQALIREFTDIALPASSSGDAQLSYRLYRRRVEVLDGMLALQPYRNADVEQQARQRYRAQGLTGVDLDAAVEAAALADALQSRQSGATTTVGAATAGNGSETREDAAWLARVSTHFARSHPSDQKVQAA